jgi:4-aminobutyrate aminotransferase-like enzyme/Ser/Thr protein kinase RdoA (MazF antagonist)
VSGFNFFEQPELPAPQVGDAAAVALLAEHYGITARVKSLGSQQDKNFLVYGDDDAVIAVLKIANPAFTATELQAQDEAAALIAAAEPQVRVAVPQPNLAGDVLTEVTGLLDGPAHVRLLRYLPGGALVGDGHLARDVIAGLGALSGRVSRALAGFEHPGLNRDLQWDLRHGKAVVDALARHVADPALRLRITAAAVDADERIAPLAETLPRQAVHLDLTDANVVATRGPGAPNPDGVIDFGDLSYTWAVSELAVTASSVLGHPGTRPTSIMPAVNAFHAIRPLNRDEAAVLWPLLVLRTAALLVSDAQQAAIDPDNEYVTGQTDEQARMFDEATSVPVDVMTAVILAELGFAQDVSPLTGEPLIVGLDPEAVATVDLSATSEVFDTGRFGVAVETAAAQAAVADGAALVVTRFGEARLTRAPFLAQDAPDVVATGLALWPAHATTLSAPWAGQVSSEGGAVVLRSDDYVVTVTDAVAVAGEHVDAGAPFATIDENTWSSVSIRPAAAPVAPPFVPADLATGWRAVARDPRPLLGLPAAAADESRDLLVRRDNSFARVQEHYYDAPPQIERGWRHHLMSTRGRVYLDMVNNVAVLGHAHPRVADAANRQLRRLNTNSRFNYEAVVEYSERLTATLPDSLDTVFLVNSGSEASDLAIRLALAATGRRDVVAVREAYHGWTYGTDAVSTSTADNPNALTTRPDWIHTVESPNSFRGKYRGSDVGRYAVDAVAEIEDMVARGRPPAGFICETVYGNAGGMALPDGYLAAVYGALRAAGGLAIADEVQVGYGRLGHWFWGFHQQGVVPDIVSVAKSTGNGYPLGAVITSRAVAEAFSSQGYFFSSTGGSPLSCAIGLTVLDVLAEEDLQGNALRVGGHLKARLEDLGGRHPLIGTVHGMGLYLGVEMVRDRETLTPATAETAAICNRMLDLGVVIQPTGDHQNILKTKPPLCIDESGADFYVDALDRVLTEGW